MKYNPAIVYHYFESQGLPYYVREHQFNGDRKWRFDFAFIDQLVALEVEGGIWTGGRHTRGTGFARDIEKYNCAVLMGWRVIRCQPQDLCTLTTVNMLKQLLTSIDDGSINRRMIPAKYRE